MRFFAGLLLLPLLSLPATAGVPCSLPFNLQNGTPADATQVMANYNALVNCLANAAAAGNNSDITSLNGLATPISPAFGGTQTYVASAAATGGPNAITVLSTSPPWQALSRGNTVIFTTSNYNSGPTTLTVGSSAAANIYRRTPDGAQALAGGELVPGVLNAATYDGGQFQLMAPVIAVPIGTVLETISPTPDVGFLLLLGQCISSTTFQALYIKMGNPATGVSGCGTGQFKLPDGRGRLVAQVDSGGSNNITVAGGNFDGTVMYAGGGLQNHTLALRELVAHQHQAFIRDPQHAHTNFGVLVPQGGAANIAAMKSDGIGSTASGAMTSESTGVKVNSVSSGAGTGTDNLTAGVVPPSGDSIGNPFSILPPVVMLNRQIKY